jgi:hypothetical protein
VFHDALVHPDTLALAERGRARRGGQALRPAVDRSNASSTSSWSTRRACTASSFVSRARPDALRRAQEEIAARAPLACLSRCGAARSSAAFAASAELAQVAAVRGLARAASCS